MIRSFSCEITDECGNRSTLSCAQDFEYIQLEYDAVSNGEYWSRRPVLVIKRALQVRRCQCMSPSRPLLQVLHSGEYFDGVETEHALFTRCRAVDST